MVMKMNKKDFLEELRKQTKYTDKECDLINEVIETHFILGKKNKERIIEDLKVKLNISEDVANEVYKIAMAIICGEIKNKLKHPFKNKEN